MIPKGPESAPQSVCRSIYLICLDLKERDLSVFCISRDETASLDTSPASLDTGHHFLLAKISMYYIKHIFTPSCIFYYTLTSGCLYISAVLCAVIVTYQYYFLWFSIDIAACSFLNCHHHIPLFISLYISPQINIC